MEVLIPYAILFGLLSVAGLYFVLKERREHEARRQERRTGQS